LGGKNKWKPKGDKLNSIKPELDFWGSIGANPNPARGKRKRNK